MVPNRCQLAWADWFAGYPDRAHTRADEALQLAMRLGRPYSIAFALQYVVSVAHLRRSYESSRIHAESLKTVAEENGFPIWQACGTASMGRIFMEDGDWTQGDPLMREGFTQARAAGGELIYLYLLSLYAEACVLHRKIVEGTRALDELSQGVQKTDMRMLETEVHRLRGELLLLDDSNAGKAEELFRTALRLAAAQGAKSWELRAASSLARLMLNQGRRDEARAIIEPVYNFFTEGFTTGDLREARSLLETTLTQPA